MALKAGMSKLGSEDGAASTQTGFENKPHHLLAKYFNLSKLLYLSFLIYEIKISLGDS